MKLYYSPAACSLAPHIALLEAGIAFDAILASTKTHKLADGTDYYTINPLGYVPLLELDDGTRITEGQVIVQYIADLAPASNLAPAAGTIERVKLQTWLSFISTELHKGFAPLFNPAMPAEAKELAKAHLAKRLAWVDGELAGKQFLTGDTFTIADGYLFTVCNWGKFVGVDTKAMENITAFMARVGARPAVQAALKAEGLTK
jgi:glutathione S-transferase